MSTESPIDRLLKQLQATQGIKGLFEPTQAQRERKRNKMAADEHVYKRFHDKLGNMYNEDDLQESWSQAHQYASSNWDNMDPNIQYLFESLEDDYKSRYQKTQDFNIYKQQFASGIKVNDIVKYQKQGESDPTFNRVSAINGTGSQITLVALGVDVAGVCQKELPSGTITTSDFKIVRPQVLDFKNSTFVEYSDSSNAIMPYYFFST